MSERVLEWAINIAVVAGIMLITAVLTGFVVYFAWNYAVPEVFGLGKIGLFQAIALSLLVKALVNKD
jgi:uncharacterized membrane protein